MFGYVKPWLPELRVREEATYRALYCGLCRTMKKTVGRLSTLSRCTRRRSSATPGPKHFPPRRCGRKAPV